MAKEIASIGLAKLTLGAHCNFHNRFNTLLTEATAEVLHLDALAPQYLELLKVENAIVNRNSSFEATPEMKDLDYKRDRLAGVLFSIVNTHKNSPIAKKQQAALALERVMKPYRAAKDHEYSRETTEIDGLLVDLSTPAMQSYIELLALEQEIEELETYNLRFDKAMSAKAQEAAERAPLSETDTVKTRRELDAIYAKMVQTINAYALIQTSAAIEKFIDDANGIIFVHKSIADNQAKKKSKPEEDEVNEELRMKNEELV